MATTSRPTWTTSAIVVMSVVVGVTGYYRLLWGDLHGFVVHVDHYDKLFCDFVNHYYPMGRMILSFPWPVDGFYYSAFFAIVLRPLGAMSPGHALWAWGVVQGVGAIMLGVLSARQLGRFGPWQAALFTLVFLTSLPLLHNLKWGQVSVVVTLTVLAASVARRDGRPVLAGVLIAFGIAIKYYSALFLVYYAVRREWRVVWVAAATAVLLLMIVPGMVLGPRAAFLFSQESFVEVSRDAHFMVEDRNSQYFPFVVQRLVGPASGLSLPVLEWVGALIALLGLRIVWALRATATQEAASVSLAVTFLAVSFVVPPSWPHYFVYLPFCQMVILRRTAEPDIGLWTRRAVRGLAVVSIALASVFVLNALQTWARYVSFPFLFVSNALLLLGFHCLPWPVSSRGNGAGAAAASF